MFNENPPRDSAAKPLSSWHTATPRTATTVPNADVVRFDHRHDYSPLRPPQSVEDQDACALYSSVRKDGKP
ncbi:MAG: hypothetical protein ACSLFF_03765, partial [Solirubrobacterales bacterium]